MPVGMVMVELGRSPTKLGVHCCFLSRVIILTRDIDIANMSIYLSVCPFRSGTRWKRL